jgi:hypothetical protein
MWLDTDKDANLSCYAIVDNKLATHAIPVICMSCGLIVWVTAAVTRRGKHA